MKIQEQLLSVKESSIFQIIVTVVILTSSLIVGVNTYEFSSFYKNILVSLDVLITVFFLIEISIRFFGEKNKKDFFKDGGIFLTQ